MRLKIIGGASVVIVVLLAVLAVCSSSAEPVRSGNIGATASVCQFGFDRFSGTSLTGAAHGELLLGELNCVACHQASDAVKKRLDSKQPPLLGQLASRISGQYLREFLAHPQQTKPGTGMPDLLSGMDEAKKSQTIENLVNFLSTLDGPATKAEPPATAELIKDGRRLYTSVGCLACHSPQEPDEIPLPHSAPLGNLSKKTSVTALADFLVDPLKARPSGRMPSLDLTRPEAVAIAAYLLRDQSPASSVNTLQGPDTSGGVNYAYYEGQWLNTPDFSKLTPKRSGTAQNFAAQPDPHTGGFAFIYNGFIEIDRAGKYVLSIHSTGSAKLMLDGSEMVNLSADVKKPRQAKASRDLQPGRHPFSLVFVEAIGKPELTVELQAPGGKLQPLPAEMLFVQAKPTARQPVIDPEKAARGKEIFSSIGCASCHQMGPGLAPIESTLKAKNFAQMDAGAAGCLSANPPADVPRFALDETQRSALADALKNRDAFTTDLPATESVSRKMSILNCYACHMRDKIGGPEPARNAYFTSNGSADMGDEGRLPPYLNETGAKLKPKWLHEVLVNHAQVRPYVTTRMPQFGEANVGSLVQELAAADAQKIPRTQFKEPAFDTSLAGEGRRIVGTSGGLGCINCHRVAGTESLGIPAMDLQYMFRRLNYEWYDAYLRDPAALRPGTRMPTFWPHNTSSLRETLGGDPERQIGAIWTYLTQGADMPLPPGLVNASAFDLTVGDEPVLFRSFIKNVGERGIAIGYPEQVHLAFDAGRVRMIEAWRGKFISAKPAWGERGGQYATPLSEDIFTFPAGAPLATLEKPDSPWPTAEGNAGKYRFLGYRFDARRWPILLYRAGELEVQEQPIGRTIRAKAGLVRRFQVSGSVGAAPLWYRAAAGNKIEPKDGGYLVDGTLFVHVVMPQSQPARIRDSGNTMELLVPVKVDPDVATDSKNRMMIPTVEVEFSW